MTDLMGRPHLAESEAETEGLGRCLAARLEPGSMVMLYGTLGAGKTTFVRGLAEGLGVSADQVSSPTFTLVQRYEGRMPLYHVDLYRIDRPAEVDDLGLDEYLADGAVVVVEWAERLPGRLQQGVEVRLEDAGDDRRRITLSRSATAGHSTR